MKIISHRGNIRGEVPSRENAPSYIDCAIGNGYDVEIDLRVVDGELWLGHDEPQYKVTHRWIRERRNSLWIHCKNLEAAKETWIYQSFCHTDDPFVFTSTGHIWLHDFSMLVDNKVIIPLMNENDILQMKNFNNAFAVCTDYPSYI